MPDPRNLDEYNKRVNLNQIVDGFGPDTTMHMPCPFCGAGHFLCYKIIETEARLANGSVCKECNRGGKCIFERTTSGVQFEFVQTSGPDQPEFLPYKMRRIS